MGLKIYTAKQSGTYNSYRFVKGIFATENKRVQEVIENSYYFKKGIIVLQGGSVKKSENTTEKTSESLPKESEKVITLEEMDYKTLKETAELSGVTYSGRPKKETLIEMIKKARS